MRKKLIRMALIAICVAVLSLGYANECTAAAAEFAAPRQVVVTVVEDTEEAAPAVMTLEDEEAPLAAGLIAAPTAGQSGFMIALMSVVLLGIVICLVLIGRQRQVFRMRIGKAGKQKPKRLAEETGKRLKK